MMMRRTELVRKTPLRNKAPMAHSREKKRPGLAQRVAESLGRAIAHVRSEPTLLRSEQHRKHVAALPCARCEVVGFSQAAHVNFGKGGGVKTCDSLTFPLCCDRPGVRGCHSLHDQGGIYSKEERPLVEWQYVDATRAQLIRKNKWDSAVEAAYQKAIQPLARVVHGEAV